MFVQKCVTLCFALLRLTARSLLPHSPHGSHIPPGCQFCRRFCRHFAIPTALAGLRHVALGPVLVPKGTARLLLWPCTISRHYESGTEFSDLPPVSHGSVNQSSEVPAFRLLEFKPSATLVGCANTALQMWRKACCNLSIVSAADLVCWEEKHLKAWLQ